MLRRPTRSNHTDSLSPYTTRFRSTVDENNVTFSLAGPYVFTPPGALLELRFFDIFTYGVLTIESECDPALCVGKHAVFEKHFRVNDERDRKSTRLNSSH